MLKANNDQKCRFVKKVEPIFVVSMPRAGSTLLQRLLMGHSSIDSCGEPWLALPLVYMLRGQGAFADYGHESSVRSIQEFVSKLPSGDEDFYRISADYLRELYTARSADDAVYFVDKTPRYYKILPELRRMFPDACRLILLRNPLGVFGSMINFVNGDLRYMPMWKSDWVEGHKMLSEAVSSVEPSYLIRFESLVSDPQGELKKVLDRLNLSYESAIVDDVAGQQLSRGDPTGVKRYKQVDKKPLETWKEVINTPTKKRLAIRWINALTEDHWRLMGYSREETLDNLARHRPSNGWSLRESFSLLVGRIYFYSGLHILKKLYLKNEYGRCPFFN